MTRLLFAGLRGAVLALMTCGALAIAGMVLFVIGYGLWTFGVMAVTTIIEDGHVWSFWMVAAVAAIGFGAGVGNAVRRRPSPVPRHDEDVLDAWGE